jgi:hypothetical protein
MLKNIKHKILFLIGINIKTMINEDIILKVNKLNYYQKETYMKKIN